MSPSPFYEVAVIGGGIVGLASALALCRQSNLRLVLVEAEDRLAAHQTGHNSGVIHSGLYYRPGSQKAQNCVLGRQALYRFCEEQDIAVRQCGKLVLATAPDQLPALDELERRGRANGIAGLTRLAPKAIAEYEPHCRGLAALHVPATGIVDYRLVCEKIGQLVRANGADIRLNARVHRVVRQSQGFILETTDGPVACHNLVNCAGLQSDRIARLCGLRPRVRIIPFRGEYFVLRPECHELVRNPIYPVPDTRFPFLGVHFTRTMAGTVEAGPNAVLACKREGYRKFSFSPRDVGSWLFYRGFWKLARRYWRTGLAEQWRSWSKKAFVRSLQHLVPDLQPDDVQPGGSGVRAQALAPDGRLVDDFLILSADRMIHVLNAPSPAATASLQIGQIIAAQVRSALGV